MPVPKCAKSHHAVTVLLTTREPVCACGWVSEHLPGGNGSFSKLIPGRGEGLGGGPCTPVRGYLSPLCGWSKSVLSKAQEVRRGSLDIWRQLEAEVGTGPTEEPQAGLGCAVLFLSRSRPTFTCLVVFYPCTSSCEIKRRICLMSVGGIQEEFPFPSHPG